MIGVLRGFIKSIPTLILSFALAVAVWISAVNAADPVKAGMLSRPITIERFGLDPSLVIANEIPNQASITVSAPRSIWDRMANDRAPVRVWIDLSGLGPGTHTVPVNAVPQETFRPSKVTSKSPETVTVTLEKLITRDFPVHLVVRGQPAIGFQADTPTVKPDRVAISGPTSRIDQIKDVRVTLDVSQASDNISRQLDVQALDANDAVVEGVTANPAQVMVNQPISQRGGYRNVVVKVASTGQVASGYRLTNISVFPPTVTVFSSNPALIDKLPGYVETSPLDLTGVKDDIDERMPLNIPNGVEVVGDQTVLVQVGVAAIEGSVTLSGLPIQVVGLPQEFAARLSPETVDVIVSGPVPLLDKLVESDVRVVMDLSGVNEGTYQFAPKVTLSIAELKVESILPSSVEVVVVNKSKITLTPPAPPLSTATATPTPRQQ